MKLIPLGKSGFFAKVDDSDFKWLCQWKWYLRAGYAWRTQWVKGSKGKWINVPMSRQILNATSACVDHINGDTLDNRKSNLRSCTKAQNRWNSKTPNNNTSGSKGVSWDKKLKKWKAYITTHGSRRHLGYFDSVEDASASRNQAVLEEHGEFGRIVTQNN